MILLHYYYILLYMWSYFILRRSSGSLHAASHLEAKDRDPKKGSAYASWLETEPEPRAQQVGTGLSTKARLEKSLEESLGI